MTVNGHLRGASRGKTIAASVHKETPAGGGVGDAVVSHTGEGLAQGRDCVGEGTHRDAGGQGNALVLQPNLDSVNHWVFAT